MDHHDRRGVGTGTATLGYTVAANRGPARSGTITIQGGQIVTVSQAGTAATTIQQQHAAAHR